MVLLLVQYNSDLGKELRCRLHVKLPEIYDLWYATFLNKTKQLKAFKGSRKEVKQEIRILEKLGYVYIETALWIYWQLQNREKVLCLIAALVAAWEEAKQKENKENVLYRASIEIGSRC